MNERWKRAYRAQFGSEADDDIANGYADDVEAWRINWQSAYDAGEEWAVAMAGEGEDDGDDDGED
ncbi:MAG TPA: hypothetical protein VFC51_12070 [Chloroflexota bacterium]|nr:hypothetical protein [Chloroflexota bacterium]